MTSHFKPKLSASSSAGDTELIPLHPTLFPPEGSTRNMLQFTLLLPSLSLLQDSSEALRRGKVVHDPLDVSEANRSLWGDRSHPPTALHRAQLLVPSVGVLTCWPPPTQPHPSEHTAEHLVSGTYSFIPV